MLFLFTVYIFFQFIFRDNFQDLQRLYEQYFYTLPHNLKRKFILDPDDNEDNVHLVSLQIINYVLTQYIKQFSRSCITSNIAL